jgi:hypothetical protein
VSKQVYFVIDKDGDVQYFEDEDKFNNYYKVNSEVQVYLGTKVDVELVPAQVVVKGGTKTRTTTKTRGPRPRDEQGRPLKADGTPFAPRGSKKNGTTTASTAN